MFGCTVSCDKVSHHREFGFGREATFAEMRKDKRITRSATPEECEEFQTLPIGYTSCVPKTHRYKMIGNGWTVDVIAHILKGIT
jgi:site-specific DNA-cytosine methylase